MTEFPPEQDMPDPGRFAELANLAQAHPELNIATQAPDEERLRGIFADYYAQYAPGTQINPTRTEAYQIEERRVLARREPVIDGAMVEVDRGDLFYQLETGEEITIPSLEWRTLRTVLSAQYESMIKGVRGASLNPLTEEATQEFVERMAEDYERLVAQRVRAIETALAGQQGQTAGGMLGAILRSRRSRSASAGSLGDVTRMVDELNLLLNNVFGDRDLGAGLRDELVPARTRAALNRLRVELSESAMLGSLRARVQSWREGDVVDVPPQAMFGEDVVAEVDRLANLVVAAHPHLMQPQEIGEYKRILVTRIDREYSDEATKQLAFEYAINGTPTIIEAPPPPAGEIEQ